MKTVFNNREIAHQWVHKGVPYGRSSSMRFNGDAFYSYNTVIARRITHKGKTAYIYDSGRFSNTTRQHQAHVRRAIPTTEQVFSVDSGSFGQDLDWTPARLRDYYLSLYRTLLKGSSRYKRVRAGYLVRAYAELQRAINVCNYFGLGCARLQKMYSSGEPLVTAAQEIIGDYQTTRDEVRAVRRQMAQAELNKRYDELLPRWLAGENVSLPFVDRPVSLRAIYVENLTAIAGTERVMETTKGARVPLADAERTFRFVMKISRTNGWRANGEQHQIGIYRLDAINEQGVIAGCHRVSWDEVTRFGKQMGWI